MGSENDEDNVNLSKLSSVDTPSAISRTANHVLNSPLAENKLKTIVRKSCKSMPRAHQYAISHSRTAQMEVKLLRRRVNNLTRSLRISKTARSQLEEQLNNMHHELEHERLRAEQYVSREKAAVNSLK